MSEEDWSIEELRNYFNTAYGLEDEWPETFEVSAATYGKICQSIFKNLIDKHVYTLVPGVGYSLPVHVGMNGGIFFKNVELRIKDAN